MSEECNFDEFDCYDFIDSYPDCDAEHPWKGKQFTQCLVLS